MRRAAWYERPVAAACAALLSLAVSSFVLRGADIGPRERSVDAAFSVTIRHYGVDAREMERSVAIPLEDALASARGAVETSSFSEYGRARVQVRFAPGIDDGEASEAVRDAAERVHRGLPSSAQRPEIGCSSDGRGPVWVAAVRPAIGGNMVPGGLLERAIKPALEKMPGAGDVEIAGSGITEVVVELDEAEAAAIGVDASDVAAELAGNDLLAAAGSLRIGGRVTTVVMDGRYASVKALEAALLQTRTNPPVAVGTVAAIRERERPSESLARVDGEPAATIAVYPGGGANLPALSAAIDQETQRLSTEYGLAFQVLSDSGAEVARSFLSTLSAAAQGAFAVAVASALLVGRGAGNRRHSAAGIARRRISRLVAVAAVPFALVIAAALLAALGFGLDRHALAGLAVGLGASVDAALLAAERLGKASGLEDGRRAMKSLVPSLASGTATTVIVLVPIAGLDALSEGVSRVAAAISAVCVVSFLGTVALMPPLVLGWTRARKGSSREPGGSAIRPARSGTRARRLARRLLALNARMCATRPAIPLAVSAIVSLAGAAAVLSMPLDPGVAPDEDAVFVHVEFEPGASAESVDLRLAAYARELARADGVEHVQSTARRGSGVVLASFDRKETDTRSVSSAARGIGVPGGFAWIQRGSSDERSFELVVAGDDDSECRDIASMVAHRVSFLPFVRETVLNYKDGPPDLVMTLDRERAAEAGVSFTRAAGALRRSIHGPVAYKRLGSGGEMDVRVTLSRDGFASTEDAASTLVGSDSGRVRIDSIMRPSRERDAGRINRRDRRRIASITMRSRPIDPREAARAVERAVADIARPAGYAIEFDRTALVTADRVAKLGWSFAVAALLAYMVTAAVTESIGAPVAILAALPPSLSVPAILHAVAGKSIDAAIACAFVAVSGMVVNASVLTVDERRSRGPLAGTGASGLYAIMRARAGALLATSGTTVAGALPFLFLDDAGGTMIRSLSFVAAAGTAASFFTAITVIPALSVVAPPLFDPLVPNEPQSQNERKP